MRHYFAMVQKLMRRQALYKFLGCFWSGGSSDPTRSIVVIMAIYFQTELMVEICSESLVRVIGKVLLMKCS